jgi:hypothetical protein
MERSYRRYQIDTYGPALNWRWHLNHPSGTRLWKMQEVDFWLEGVNGRRRRPFGDAAGQNRSVIRLNWSPERRRSTSMLHSR